MIWYFLGWVLPGIVSFHIFIYIMERQITVTDISIGFILGVALGPIAVIFMVMAIVAQYGDIVVFPSKRKYWFFRKGKSI
jgi:hypothetical protein